MEHLKPDTPNKLAVHMCRSMLSVTFHLEAETASRHGPGSTTRSSTGEQVHVHERERERERESKCVKGCTERERERESEGGIVCLCLSMSTMQLASLHSLIFAVTPSLADTRVQLSTSSLDTPTLNILRCFLI